MRPERITEVSDTGDLYGGMWILAKHEDGSLFVERWHGPDDGEDAPVYPWTVFTVFRVDLPDDVAAEHDWAYPFDGCDPEAGRHADPARRAWELAAVGDHFGWEELDHYPLKLTATELWERWGQEPSEDKRQDYLDPTYDQLLLDAELPAKLSDREREVLRDHGVDRLYAALVSAELGQWDFWQCLAEAVRRIGRTHDADAGGDTTHRWAVEQTVEHLWKMEGSGMPREEAVVLVADPRAGVARVLRTREGDGWIWRKWREEKP